MLRRFLPALLTFFLVAGTAISAYRVVDGSGDVSLYDDIGRRAAIGIADQSKAIESEYPPVQTSLFFVLHQLSASIPFSTLWILLFLVLAAAVNAYEIFLAKGNAAPFFNAALLITLVMVGPELTFARYDYLLFFLLFLCWRAHAAKRYAESGAFLLLAVGCKIVPLILWPALLLATPKDKRKWTMLGSAIGGFLVVEVPLLLLGVRKTIENVQYLSQYHTARGIQAESTWSSWQFLLARISGGKVDVGLHHGAWHNQLLSPWVESLASVIILGGVVAFTLLLWRKLQQGKAPLPAIFGALIAWALFWSPVLSPQYLLWIVPLLIAWLCDEWTRKNDRPPLYPIAFTVSAIALCTGIFSILGGIEKGEFPLLLLLLARNAGFAILFGLLWSFLFPPLLSPPSRA